MDCQFIKIQQQSNCQHHNHYGNQEINRKNLPVFVHFYHLVKVIVSPFLQSGVVLLKPNAGFGLGMAIPFLTIVWSSSAPSIVIEYEAKPPPELIVILQFLMFFPDGAVITGTS